jgi:hypothetical protein
MLYWICPECGHECSPAIRECPTCTAPPVAQEMVAQETVASNELLSLAQTFQSGASVAVLAPPAAVAVQEPMEERVEAAPPKPDPQPSHKLAPLDILGWNPVRPRRSREVKLTATPVPVRVSSPAAPPAAFLRAEFGLQKAGLVPPGEVSFQAARAGQPTSLEQPAEPLPTRRQSVAFVRAEIPAADHSGMGFSDLAQLVGQPEVRLKPVVPHQNGQPQNGRQDNEVSTPLAYKPAELSLVPSKLKLTGESLAELLNALKIAAEETDNAAIHAIEESFREQPAVCLLAAPADIVAPPAPPAAQLLRSQKPKFTAIAPEYSGRFNAVAGPQAPPLAGPSLPPQLVNFHNHLRRNRKRASVWPVSMLIGTVVILGAVSLFQYMTPNRDTKAATVDTPVQVVRASPPSKVRVVEEHPAARSVEVAGVRVITGINKRPQLQYLIINHSSSELTGLNIRIAVRSVESSEDAPLFIVSSVVASLGPNQSKEIRADLDPSVSTSSIPDWHSLRTEVLVARQ